MMIKKIPRSFADLAKVASSKSESGKPSKLAVPATIGSSALEGIDLAVQLGIASVSLFGSPKELEQARSISPELADKGKTVSIDDPQSLLKVIDSLAREGQVDMTILPRQEIRDQFDPGQSNKRPLVKSGKLLSHIAVAEFSKQNRLILISDGLITTEPSLKDKINLVGNLMSMALSIGLSEPKVAVLAAVEVVYPQMMVTVEAAALAIMSRRGQFKDGIVDGPLSFDVALEPEVAFSKSVTDSAVAGKADCLLAPNLVTAVAMVQGITLGGGARGGNLVVGGLIPIVPVFETDRAESIYRSLILARLNVV